MNPMSFSAKDILGLFSLALIHAFAVSTASLDIMIDQEEGASVVLRIVYTGSLTCTLLALGFVSRVVDIRRMAVIEALLPFPLVAASGIVVAVSLSGEVPMLLFFGAWVALGAANGCVLVRLGMFFSTLNRPKAFMFAAVALLIAGVVLAVIIGMDQPSSMFLTLLLLAASAAMSSFTPLPTLDKNTVKLKESRFPLELISSYVGSDRKSTFFVIMFFYCVAFGYCEFGPPQQSAQIAFQPIAVSTLLAGVAAVLYVRITRAQSDLFLAQWGLLALLVVGVAMPMTAEHSLILGSIAFILISVGFSCYDMSNWCALYEVSQKENPALIYGVGRAVMCFGLLVGQLIYQVLMEVLPNRTDVQATLLFLILCIFFFCLVLSNMGLFKIREKVEASAKNKGSESMRTDMEAACRAIAEKCGLTPRETEVLDLLARGRNVDYIQEALVISRYTARSHVYHIYQKLDVHSHQELIDVVESCL